jgi:hypothetical protein
MAAGSHKFLVLKAREEAKSTAKAKSNTPP